uniref:hypothetical protein n=1 Tax=uncultured Draconibacterium sp. TaxID=1573823 RepID=UPI003217F1ED
MQKITVEITVEIRLFDPKINKPRPSEDDITFSEDVCIIDENNLHGVACFNFEDMEWMFHTDTLVDYNEEGAETKWRWYYPPLKDTDIEFETI